MGSVDLENTNCNQDWNYKFDAKCFRAAWGWKANVGIKGPITNMMQNTFEQRWAGKPMLESWTQ